MERSPVQANLELVRLTPEQVSNRWDEIRPELVKALPFGRQRKAMVEILNNILLEQAVLWVFYINGEPKAVVLTTLQRDPLVPVHSLLIYAFSTLDKLEIKHFSFILDRLKVYARNLKVTHINAFTKPGKWSALVERLDGNTEWDLISWEV